MDATIANIIAQIFATAAAAVLSGWAVMATTQLLKWKLLLAPAKKWPRETAAALALVTGLGAVWVLDLVILDNVVGWLVYLVATVLVATQSYDAIRALVNKYRES